jgi:hypothetical protein
MPGNNSQRLGTANTSKFVICVVLFVIHVVLLLIVMFCVLFIVNVYCHRVSTKCVLPPGVNPIAVDKYININMIERRRPQMTIWRMRIACWIPKATVTHSEYVILIVFPLQQWLHERASVYRYTYSGCVVVCCTEWCMLLQRGLMVTA